MKLIMVPHGAKLAPVNQYPAALASDPPMSMDGKAKMLALVPQLREQGPYYAVYCSIMDRACGSMCTVVKALGYKRVVCIDPLGQMGNLDSDGTVYRYPGHENDDVITWQGQGMEAVQLMKMEMDLIGGPEKTVLAFSHRPILAGLVAKTRNILDAPGIQAILDNPALTKDGFVGFYYNGGTLSLA